MPRRPARPDRDATLPSAAGRDPARAEAIAAQTGGSITVTDDPYAALTRADVVITDTWVSMGMEAEKESRHGAGSPFEKFAVTPT